MYRHIALAITVLLLVFGSVRGYKLSRSYTGNDFINDFDFWDDGVQSDPTGSSSAPSAAYYMPRDAAQQRNLVWVDSQGHFRLSVDSTYTYGGNDLRPSVRITTKQSIHYGLLILDAVHLPYGTGTWPAFWLSGADGDWPNSGEIDIYEGIGNSNNNTVSYHTSEGCRYDTSVRQTAAFNNTAGVDCNALKNNDQACGSVDPNTSSYGSGANSVGGGVYALEWTSDHIKTWHFSRNQIPRDITNGNPNPDSWGTPVTNLDSNYCDIDAYFGPQSIIFNIELCGTWQGAVFDGGPSACVDFVQKNPSAFQSAYFEIASLKYYQ